MKHTTILSLFTLLAAGLALRAAPLASDTPVYAAPATTAGITGTLAAGTTPPPVTSPLVVALPPGWQAVERADAQDCWVRDNDLDKELNVKSGALLRSAPDADSAVTGTMTAGDLSDLRDVKGRWVQVRHTKRAIGYIQTPAADAAPAVVATATVTVTATATTPSISPQTLAALLQAQPQPQPQPQTQSQTTAAAPAPTTTIVTPTPAPAPTPTPTARAGAPAPRGFEGTFAIARRGFLRSPYDYQLNDSTGARFAYLDLSAMPANQRPEIQEGKTVIIYGAMLPVPGTKDIVIKVETLQLK